MHSPSLVESRRPALLAAACFDTSAMLWVVRTRDDPHRSIAAVANYGVAFGVAPDVAFDLTAP
jgi:hypothetical protein